MKDPILIVGASGHAKVIVDIVEREGRHRIVGFLDRSIPPGVEFCGYRVLGRDDEAAKFSGSASGCIVAIGDNHVRSLVVAKIGQSIPFVTAVHPSASLGRDVEVGPGTVVMAGAIVNPGCRIGAHCILNTGASLDHDSFMGDFSSLAPGVVTGGDCHIGVFSAVSIGAIVKHGVRIGADCVVGAGALVLSDLDSCKVAYGCPARIIRGRTRGDSYL